MNKLFRQIFAFYVFAYAVFFASRPIGDADFWWHLKTGQYILQTKTVPTTDLFSFTNYGRPWIAVGWLSEVLFYAIYSRLGFNALIFIFAILAAVAFWIVFRRCDSHPFIAGFATLLGVWTVLSTIGVRPRVFTLLLASIYLALLGGFTAKRKEGAKAIWWLVPLMILWANLHGGYVIGLALIALTMIGIPLDKWAKGEAIGQELRRLRTLALVLFGCLLGALLNPYGLANYKFAFDILRSPVYQNLVQDWLSPNFHEAELLPLMLLILLTVAALALSPKRVKPSELLLFLATLYATLKTQRNLAIFALVAVPLFANYTQSWLSSISFGKSFDRPASSNRNPLAILMSVLLLLPLAVFGIKLKTTIYAPPSQKMISVPLKAVEFLKENQITGNTFTEPNMWGGYLIWALPSNPVYIDGRGMYPEEFVKEYVGITWGVTDWRGPFDRYNVRVVVVSPRSVLKRELKESSAWQQVFEDEMAIVFTRP